MSRLGREPRPELEIRPGTMEQVQAFFEHLRQTYRYEPWYTDDDMEEWKIQDKAGGLDVSVAYVPGTEQVAGVTVTRPMLASREAAHILFVVADKQFADPHFLTTMAHRLQRKYRWLTLIAMSIIPELEIPEKVLVRAYRKLGFKVKKKIYHGTEMEWKRKKASQDELEETDS